MIEEMVVETRHGRAWVEERTETDATSIYHALMCDMLAKKLHGCTYITRITDTNLYNGYRHITVTYTGGVRRHYWIKF